MQKCLVNGGIGALLIHEGGWTESLRQYRGVGGRWRLGAVVLEQSACLIDTGRCAEKGRGYALQQTTKRPRLSGAFLLG